MPSGWNGLSQVLHDLLALFSQVCSDVIISAGFSPNSMEKSYSPLIVISLSLLLILFFLLEFACLNLFIIWLSGLELSQGEGIWCLEQSLGAKGAQ